MHCKDVVVVFLVAVLSTALNAGAQDASTVQKGAKVRITPLTGHTIIGWIHAVDESSITVQNSAADPAERRVKRDEIRTLEVSRGTRGHALAGMAIGAGVGVLVDLIGTAAGGSGTSACDYGACVLLPAMGAAAGGLLGLAARDDKWEVVSSQRLAVAAVPVRGRGLAVVARFSF